MYYARIRLGHSIHAFASESERDGWCAAVDRQAHELGMDARAERLSERSARVYANVSWPEDTYLVCYGAAKPEPSWDDEEGVWLPALIHTDVDRIDWRKVACHAEA